MLGIRRGRGVKCDFGHFQENCIVTIQYILSFGHLCSCNIFSKIKVYIQFLSIFHVRFLDFLWAMPGGGTQDLMRLGPPHCGNPCGEYTLSPNQKCMLLVQFCL